MVPSGARLYRACFHVFVPILAMTRSMTASGACIQKILVSLILLEFLTDSVIPVYSRPVQSMRGITRSIMGSHHHLHYNMGKGSGSVVVFIFSFFGDHLRPLQFLASFPLLSVLQTNANQKSKIHSSAGWIIL